MTNKLESEMREFARRLYNERIAYLFKVPEEMQQTPCDFFGWTPQGKAITLECKQVKRNLLPIGTSNGLAAHQWNALELAFKCGAHSILVWRSGEQTVALTFQEILALSYKRKSIEWPGYTKPHWQDSIRAFVQANQ
jgi:hypothetical protein